MYQVLYRKYRPKTFSDVYGQDHVISTLKNEINDGRVSHAYLFTGSRGTGKTTCAKILAKAVNCENSHDGEPCNECQICKGLDNGSIYDVVEIDAASNNGVDNIRDLREEANYTPSRGKYRVYIIDEVHMLSTGAFNALLKTLEEPPAHVIFILATTEVHKIPATILSRCQRFDFKRIQPETMAVRLKQVAQLENMTITDEAAVLIARIADGALRDGLSILDQCAGRSKSIDEQLVSQVAGLAGKQALHQLADCISAKDSNGAMGIISSLYQNSYDMQRLCVELINHFRNLLVVKTVKKSRELIICTDDEYNSIVACADKFTVEGIIYALDLFQQTLVTIKGGASARIEVEMAFVKLCEPKLDQSVNALLDRLSALERAVKNGVVAAVNTQPAPIQQVPVQQAPVQPVVEQSVVKEEPQPSAPASQPTAPLVPDAPKADENQPDFQAPTPAPEQESTQPQPAPTPSAPPADNGVQVEFDRWGELMDELCKTDMVMFGVLNGSKAFVRGEFFLIDSANQTVSELIRMKSHAVAIKKALYNVTGYVYKLGLVKKKSEDVVKRDPLEDLINMAQNNINIDLK